MTRKTDPAAAPFAPRAAWKVRVLALVAVLGPGLLAGLSDDDPAGITTYSVLGAQYGYQLLWVLLLSTIALIVFHNLGARMGVVTGQGLIGLIRQRYGVRSALFALTALLLANGSVALIDDGLGQGRPMRLRQVQVPPSRSGFAGFRFPPDVIVLAVRWYLRYGLSYRDVEELLAERGIEVDHVTVYRWVQRFTLLLIDAARPCRHVPGDRWFVDETYLKVAGPWVYLYRAIDQCGQVIDVLASPKRDLAAPRRFFTRALKHGPSPTEVVTDKAAVYPPILEEIALGAWHHTERYANNRIESDHGQLKFRLRPMRGLKKLRCAQVISAGHAFIQNIRRGHYEPGVEETVNLRVLAAFDELALAI